MTGSIVADQRPSSPLLDAALGYADSGWRVIPLHQATPDRNGGHICSCSKKDCTNAAKHPRTKHGLKDATTDENQIRDWWKMWPKANIGLVTGEESGLVVLDVDPRHGGDLSIDELTRRVGALPETAEVITGGGGRHLYFRHPGAPVRNAAGLCGNAGLDVRGDGGYIVAPPSLHISGQAYQWEVSSHPDDVPLAPIPEALLKLMTERQQSYSGNGKPDDLLHDVDTPILEGRRNSELTRLAGRIRRRGIGSFDMRLALLHANEKLCEPPLAKDEVERIATSVARYEPAQSGQGGDADGRPVIIVRSEMAKVNDEAERALLEDKSAGVYVRSGRLVRVRRDSAPRVRGLSRSPGTPIITRISAEHLREKLDRIAIWRKQVGESLKPALPPEWTAKTLLERGEWPFPPLVEVIETPTLRPDGSVLDKPGYDYQTGVLYDPGRTDFPAVPANPSLGDAVAALETLREPFTDFPFLTECDRGAFLAYVLALLVRPAIEGCCPLTAIRAPTPSSGKGLLALSAALIAMGRPPTLMTDPHNDGEVRKRILAVALEGIRNVLIDNVVGRFGTPSIAAALTSTTFSDRLLGANKTVQAPLHTVWGLTGNNVTFQGDLPRRVVVCDLDPEIEHPEDRSQGDYRHPDLPGYLFEIRPQLVVAGLTILRAFHLAGRPAHANPPLGSFEEWDALVRSALIWCGEGDPDGGRNRIRESADTDMEALGGALQMWVEVFNSEATTCAEAIRKSEENDALRLALANYAGCGPEKLNANKVGYTMRGNANRIVGGLRFERNTGSSHGSARWKAVQMDHPGGDGGDSGDEPYRQEKESQSI